MAGPWTTDDLLAECKLTPFWSDSDGPLTDAELLRLANSELVTTVLPFVLNASKGNWRSENYDDAITADQGGYRMPPRALGGKLYDVVIVDSNGDEASIPMITERKSADRYAGWARYRLAFYVKNGKVYLDPTPTATQNTLRMKYPMRPGKLVATSQASTPASAKIVTVGAADSGGAGFRRLTCDTVPTAWGTSDTYDFIRGDGVFETTHVDLTANAVSTGASGYLDFTETDLTTSEFQAGDYINLADESCMIQLPDVSHPLLVQRVAMRMAVTNRDMESYKLEGDVYKAMEAQVAPLLDPRIEGASEIVVPTYSPLREMVGIASGGRWRS